MSNKLLTAIILGMLVISSGAVVYRPYGYLKQSTVQLQHGTGFYAQGASGHIYLFTNWHVCQSSSSPGAMYMDSDAPPIILKVSVKTDLCAVEASQDVYSLVLSQESPDLDTTLHTRGYPEGELRVSSGHILGMSRWEHKFGALTGVCQPGMVGLGHACTITFQDYKTSLISLPGSSGSPVVNNSGELVGVISNYDKNHINRAGMVTYENLKEFMKDL